MDVTSLFTNKDLVSRIQERLPELFYIAELESSRAGKVGMEVGSARERILIALLIYAFGQENIDTNIPITEPEIDVIVMGKALSIKTITGAKARGVKIVWTVDALQAMKFSQEYSPRCDVLLVHIHWGGMGGVFFFPVSAQMDILNRIGRQHYTKLPKVGTNPRGVEITDQALALLVSHPQTLRVPITWYRKKVYYSPYDRWLDYWRKA